MNIMNEQPQPEAHHDAHVTELTKLALRLHAESYRSGSRSAVLDACAIRIIPVLVSEITGLSDIYHRTPDKVAGAAHKALQAVTAAITSIEQEIAKENQ